MHADMEKIESAIWFCDYDDRETWITCGMAIKDELGEAGFDIWDAWSASSSKYNPRISQVTWRSFRRSGISIASMFKMAMEGGWRPSASSTRPSMEEMRKREEQRAIERAKLDREAEQAQDRAARKAGWILSQAKQEQHAYLHSKGFKEATGAVWWQAEDNNLLCIPMRYRGNLCGVQLINRKGEKRFLSGQRTAHAEFTIDNDGVGAKHWWCEGYATALSLRECLKMLRQRYVIHVTFSAGNLKKMAHSGFVVADHDESKTGENAAIETGLPYFLPPLGDFNDLHKRDGLVKTALALQGWMAKQRKTR